MTQASQDFGTLLQRARDGDEQAVTEIVRQYEGVLRRAARTLLGPLLRPQLDSVDLMQSVHRSLWIGLRHGKFDISTPENLIALALTMVRRKVARKWRNTKRGPKTVRPAAGPDDPGLDLDKLVGQSDGPASIVQLDDQLNHAMQDLDPIDRKLVELRLQGYGTLEVARQLGADPAHLRVRLTRLRRRLREQGLLQEWI